MEQVEVEIVTETITAQYGTLTVGTILRTDADYATHLVDDHRAAKYSKPKTKLPASKTSAARAVPVQTSAQDPYAHLGTLIAAVPRADDVAVQTSAQASEPPVGD
jgi:hypothetical protein